MRRIFNKDMPCLQPSQCSLCGEILSRKHGLREHMVDKHSSSKKITCTIENCGYKTNRIGNYHLHLEKSHKIKLPLISCYSTGCGKKCRNEYSMIRHMRKCVKKPDFKTIKCPEKNCNEEFLTRQGLENHFKIKHDSLLIEKTSDIQRFHEEIEELISS